MKILDVFHDANANLFRNKVRSALTIIAIFVGSFAIITNTAIQTGVNAFIDEQINSYGGEDYIGIANKETMEIMMDNMMMMDTEVKEYDPNKNQTTPTAITEEQLQKLKELDGIFVRVVAERIGHFWHNHDFVLFAVVVWLCAGSPTPPQWTVEVT